MWSSRRKTALAQWQGPPSLRLQGCAVRALPSPILSLHFEMCHECIIFDDHSEENDFGETNSSEMKEKGSAFLNVPLKKSKYADGSTSASGSVS